MPKGGYANRYVLTSKIQSETAYYRDELAKGNIDDVQLSLKENETLNKNKKMEVSELLDTIGIVKAIQESKKSRNIFQSIIAFFTGRISKENKILNAADDLFKAHPECGMNTETISKTDSSVVGMFVEKLCDDEKLSKESSASKEIINPEIKDTGVHNVTEDEMTQALINEKNREAEDRQRQEEFQKKLAETFVSSENIAYGNKVIDEYDKSLEKEEGLEI